MERGGLDEESDDWDMNDNDTSTLVHTPTDAPTQTATSAEECEYAKEYLFGPPPRERRMAPKEGPPPQQVGECWQKQQTQLDIGNDG